ncbi:hydrogenase maturation nickel metallochaperone HypA/HybF [Nocardioides sp. MAHUQ-72]|uniref:hydrogenase maturation nickel metallochaperone HypA/HybF n=1 Tax=unclassified Nocardioides TaxID=2615069 RepID=UPI00361A179C
MHELALTQSLVDLVVDRTVGRTVAAVHLRVGELSGVVPEAMEFCFEVVAAGGPLEGATLVVERTVGDELDLSHVELVREAPCA